MFKKGDMSKNRFFHKGDMSVNRLWMKGSSMENPFHPPNQIPDEKQQANPLEKSVRR